MTDYPAIARELNRRMLENPEKKLSIIQEFYSEMVKAGQGETADFVLTLMAMMTVGNNSDSVSFNAPAEVNMHVQSATPLFRIMIVVVGVLALSITGGGIYAIYKNSLSDTKMNILGMDISTGHVGVALVGLGVIMLIVIFRSIAKHVYNLASLPEKPQRGKPSQKP